MKRILIISPVLWLWFSSCKKSKDETVTPTTPSVSQSTATLPGDVVVNWNQITVNETKIAGLNSNLGSRIDAIEAIAVYDAINSIRRFGTPYNYYIFPSNVASAQAAAAQAAHDVLVKYFPTRQAFLDSSLKVSLASITESGIAAGQLVGAASAAEIIALRTNDGSSPNATYAGPAKPGIGQWRPTPTGFAPGINKQWGSVTPFLLSSSSQYLPAAPPAVGSPAYQTAYNEVKGIGSDTSTLRTDDQNHIAQFYKQDAELTVNEAARLLATSYKSSLEDAALVFLLTDIAEADARIAVWNAKYNFNFWRPVTAINANDSGAVTNNYADWNPSIVTPAHPSYPSGHSATVTAGFEILKSFYGDANQLTLHTTTVGEPARTISSLSVGESENGQSRIYGGIHFAFDNTVGQDIGKKVATYVLSKGPKRK